MSEPVRQVALRTLDALLMSCYDQCMGGYGDYRDYGEHRDGSKLGKIAASIAVAVATEEARRLRQARSAVLEAGNLFIGCCKEAAGVHKARAELKNALYQALRVYRFGKRHMLFVRIQMEADDVMMAINGTDVSAAILAIKKLEQSLDELATLRWIPRRTRRDAAEDCLDD